MKDRRFPCGMALALLLVALGLLAMSREQPETGTDWPPLPAPSSRGVILAWNNTFPESRLTAKWYARHVGFTGAYLHTPRGAAWCWPYLASGVRLFPGLPFREGTFAEGAVGVSYQYLARRGSANPYHPDWERVLDDQIARLFDPVSLSPPLRENIRYVLLDSECPILPPNVRLSPPGQAEATAMVAAAARAAGALRPDEPFPVLVYGMATEEPRLFDEDGALREESPEYRVLDWWFTGGGGPGRVWHGTMERVRRRLPKVYAATDPICGNEARSPVPVFAARSAGLDFVQNWFNITGAAERLPIFSAMMLQMAKASGLPVVQGPQIFGRLDSEETYTRDLLLTANLLTLAFNPRNGATDPDVPWGILHWGIPRLTRGASPVVGLVRPDADTARRLSRFTDRNVAEALPAIRETREFMDRHADILDRMEDLPAKVGILVTRASAYVGPGGQWFVYFNRISEYPYPLLLSHIPFEFVTEDGDWERFPVLVIPSHSYLTDGLARRLARFHGKITGTGVPVRLRARLPGWVDPPPVREVGNWPWGNQEGYPLGGHFREMDAVRLHAWLLDRTEKLGRFFAGLVGEPEIVCGPEVVVNVVRVGDRHAIFAVNHHLRPGTSDRALDRVAPYSTEIGVRGHWRNGRQDNLRGITWFPVRFDGPGAAVWFLDPA